MARRGPIITAAIALAAAVAWAVVARPPHHALPPVPAADREVAWIYQATATAAWERFVTAVHRAKLDWPALEVDDTAADLGETTAVPEVVIGVAGREGKLRVRWYKITSDTPTDAWVRRLAARRVAPLAVIGGSTTDRAAELARYLAAEPDWQPEPPLLLVTTATADRIDSETGGPDAPELTSLYPGRTFRYCFTNRQMADAVVDFVWSQAPLRPRGDILPALLAVGTAPLDPWGAAGLCYDAHDNPASVSALEWDDDPYSVDLARQFQRALHENKHGPVIVREKRRIPYSVGGYYQPNAWEAQAADALLDVLNRSSPLEKQLLVLPTATNQARRVLRALTGAAPLVGRNLVALSGDGIPMNAVLRDADVSWSIRAVPVPLVFFLHRDPVAWDWPAAEEGGTAPLPRSAWPPHTLAPPTSTDDVLLFQDIVRELAAAAFGPADQPLADRLRGQNFDEQGNRRGGRGEHVVWLRPVFTADGVPGGQVAAGAELEVWARAAGPGQWEKRRWLRTGRPAVVPEEGR